MMSKIKYPCGVCSRSVANNHNAVYCDSCDSWVHIKCNFLNKKTYKKLQKDNNPWFCIKCLRNQLPFQSQVNVNDSQKQQIATESDKNSKFRALFENIDCNEDCPMSEYYTPQELSKVNLGNCNLYIHLNISSLSYHIDDLNLLLSEIQHKPKIIAISESKLRKNKEPLAKIDIPGYKYEFTLTDSEKGGTLLYIAQDLNYKTRKDLNIVQSKQLESTFVEITNENKKNTIVGCIYKHPNMTITEFLTDYLDLLLQKIAFEKKKR